MAGKSVEKIRDADGQIIKHRSLSNVAIWKLCGLSDVKTTLPIQRLSWWQKLCANPHEHEHFLTVFFRKVKLELTKDEQLKVDS